MNNNYLKLIDQAHKLQLANKLQEAKVIYKKLLGVCFDNMYLFFYYAQLHVSLSDYETAIKYYHKALELDKNNFDVIFNLSLAYKSNNDIDKAIEYALIAFDIKFDDYKNLLHLSNLYAQKEDINSQFNYLSRAAFVSNSPKLFFSCGLLAKKAENYDLAIELFQKVLEFENDNTAAMIQIALIYVNYDKNVAIEMFEDLYNNNVFEKNVLTYLAILYREFNNKDKSLFYSQKLYECFPDDVHAITLLAFAYFNNNMFESSLELSKRLFEIDSENSDYGVLYALCLMVNNQKDLAMELLMKFKDNPNAEKEIFSIKLTSKNFEDVKEWYFKQYSQTVDKDAIEDALKISFYKNDYFNEYKITEQQFINNFDYKSSSDYQNRENFSKKQWKNEDITGKRVLIHNPNGFGDFIMFVRYVEELKQKAQSVDFALKEQLLPLVKYNFPKSNVYSISSLIDVENYDYITSVMCLFYNLNKDLYSIPKSDGYLSVEENLILEKQKILNLNNKKLNVGLYWQGNPTILKNRSIKLEYFLQIISDQNINAFSFQMSNEDNESDELKKSINIFDLQPYISNFLDTAAFLKNIDVLVTIDTSIAHLAGALGVKTYLLLPQLTEWRWFNDTETTPWYDSVRIFKQTKEDNWETLLVRVHEQLKKDYESKI